LEKYRIVYFQSTYATVKLCSCTYEELVDSCKPTEPTTTTSTKAPEPTTEAPEPTTAAPEPTTEAPEPETTTEPEEPETTVEPEEPTEAPEPDTTVEPEEPTEAPEPDTTVEPEEPTEAPEPEPSTEVICEHKTSELSCETGSIQVVSAFYGRQDEETCPSKYILTTDCAADRLEYVQSL
jgi:hypothetical protein